MESGEIEVIKGLMAGKGINSITIDITKSKGCWATYALPSVMMGKPADKEVFNLYEFEGLTIYLNKGLPFSRELIIQQLKRLAY